MNPNYFVSALIAFIVAVVVAVVAVSSFTDGTATPSEPAAGASQSAPGEFPEGALLGNAFSKYVTGTIGAGENQTAYRNTSGRTQYVDLATVRTTGTASTTQRITVGKSTSSTIANFTAATFAESSLINYVLATSSAATTTASVQGSAAVDRAGVIALADGEYLIFALTQTFLQGNCSGSVCETATSTNRGFNLEVMARVLQIKDR